MILKFGRAIKLSQILRHCKCYCHSAAQQNKASVRVRFAPSPTGQIHLGGLRTALYNFLFAKANGGKFILRFEDTDQGRCVPGAMEALIGCLEWAKIIPDEGPKYGGKHGPYIQSERLELYKDMSLRLLENETAYRCFCSERRLELLRKEALKRRETPKYDNRCRHLSEAEIKDNLSKGLPYTVRLKLEHYTEPWNDLVFGSIVTDVASIEGDPILMKTDGFPTYHFANVVDDHFMDITHVLRGKEWMVSTTKHLLLYKAFDWDPPQFGHLPLLLNKDGKKLSKRQGDIHVEHFKSQGFYPETILNLLTDVGSGFKNKDTAGFDMDQLIENFDLSLMNVNSTRVDFDKLSDLNKLQLGNRIQDSCQRKQLVVQLVDRIEEKYQEELLESPLDISEEYVANVLECTKGRLNYLDDLLNVDQRYLWLAPSSLQVLGLLPKNSLDFAEELLAALISSINDPGVNLDDLEQMKMTLKTLCKEQGLSLGAGMKVFRAALSGLKEGPSIAEMILALGRDNTAHRLQYAINSMKTMDS